MKKTIPLISALLTLGGCATTYHEPALPADHPANPAAEASPPPEPSRTLATAASAKVATPAAQPSPGSEPSGGHQGHGTSPPKPGNDGGNKP